LKYLLLLLFTTACAEVVVEELEPGVYCYVETKQEKKTVRKYRKIRNKVNKLKKA